MHRLLYIYLLLIAVVNCQLNLKNDLKSKFNLASAATEATPCACGVFMSGQFKKGSSEQPKGSAALIQETDINYPCNAMGTKQCINKCLESIVKHLPNSPAIVCGTIDRDCHRERAYLFVQNCNSSNWINSNLSAGREYCCKLGEPVSCFESIKV